MAAGGAADLAGGPRPARGGGRAGAPRGAPRRDDGAYRLGPSDGTLSLRTGRNGAAAKAGHDLLIHATAWEARLAIGEDAAGSSLALDVDGASLRVIEGSGGMKALTDSDRSDIRQTIDDEILKGERVTFRSTQVQPKPTAAG